ncbi:MAG: hypothetical protein L0H53_12125 [Candidatus Nitrosocosmicus sp.]|nr:hypothetical protein [Candidatus Nitrosocosmicus sp.]
MNSSKSKSNINSKVKTEFKTCPRLNCNNIGKNPLKIIYIDKVAYFCESCTKELLELNLANREND